MEEKKSLEYLLGEFLTPIIENAVEKVLVRYWNQKPAAPEQYVQNILTVEMVAEHLHLSVPTVYGLVHSRAIPNYKVGKRLYFKKEEIDKWIAGGRRMTLDEIKEAARESLVRQKRRS